jgi:hypothetical protein
VTAREADNPSDSQAPLPSRLAGGTAPTDVHLPVATGINVGVAGASAATEHKRRRANQERQIEEKWGTGRLGRFVKLVSDEPQSTRAWAKGAEGEQALARRLTDELTSIAVVLHDRKVPGTRGNIDHLVVAPSGVWVIDAKNYSGKVEQRDVGGWFSTDRRLYVGGRDRSKLVDGLSWQVDAVRAALSPCGFNEVPVQASLCFTNSEWGLFTRPIQMNGVLITWASRLVEAVRQSGPLDAAAIELLALHLSSQLPASL